MIQRTCVLTLLALAGTILPLEGLTSSPGEQAYVVTTNGATWQLDTTLVPTRDQMAKVLAIAKERNARDYVFFAICSNTGLRLSEVAHIKAEDVLDGKLRITRRKKRVLQPSILDVSDALWPIISEWAASFDGYIFPGTARPCIIHRTRKDKAPWDERVCPGGHVHVRTLQRAWAMVVAEAGLRKHGRGIHQTRHYFATEMYTATRDLRATQVALAHSSSSMTERYAHVVEMKEKINLVRPML